MELINSPGSVGQNFTGMVLDDEAAASIADMTYRDPSTGRFRPEKQLAAVDGRPAEGTWKLEVRDLSPGDVGTVNSWALDFTLGEPARTNSGSGTYRFLGVAPGQYAVRDVLPAGWARTSPASGRHLVTLAAVGSASALDFGGREWRPATVVGRYLFHKSCGPGGGPPADLQVPDKAPLLPGEKASFRNVSSDAAGITAVVIDLASLPGSDDPTADDFALAVWDGAGAAGWSAAPPAAVAVRRGGGVGGPDRVVLTFVAGAVRNTWLRVTARAGTSAGLAAPDVFYFGNLVGETGDSAAAPTVSAIDVMATRQAASARTAAGVARYDFNGDGVANVLDVAVARATSGEHSACWRRHDAEQRRAGNATGGRRRSGCAETPRPFARPVPLLPSHRLVDHGIATIRAVFGGRRRGRMAGLAFRGR